MTEYDGRTSGAMHSKLSESAPQTFTYLVENEFSMFPFFKNHSVIDENNLEKTINWHMGKFFRLGGGQEKGIGE